MQGKIMSSSDMSAVTEADLAWPADNDKAVQRRNNKTSLDYRILAEIGIVLKWLGISAARWGIYFDGQLRIGSSGESARFELETIDGVWEVPGGVTYGCHVTSLIAYVLNVGRAEATKRVSGLLDALERGTDLESVSDIGLSDRPVTAQIVPVPVDAPPLPSTFGWLGEPAEVYPIRSESGDLLGYTLRFDDFSSGAGPCGLGRPFYFPLTYWKTADGSAVWRTKHLSGNLPLFGVDQLRERPNDPVVITQDERSSGYTDSRKFAPGAVGLGLISAPDVLERTDLSPIAGRTVYIFPNLGTAGEAFAEQVRERLFRHNPQTRIAVISLVLHKPQPKDAPSLFDADPYADTSIEGWGLVHAINWRIEQRGVFRLKVPKPRLQARQFGDFSVKKAGVFVQRYDKEGEPFHAQLSSRIDITALARNRDSDEWGVCVEFEDPDERYHVWCIPRGLLGGDTAAFCKPLLSMGATVSMAKIDKDDLGRYFLTSDPGARALSVSNSGWCRGQFVFPDGTVMGRSKERVVFQTADPTVGNTCQVSGTLADWKTNVAALCQRNSRLVLAVCTALTGPVLNLLGEENGGVHFRGESSTGKTTTESPAASVWGAPSKNIRLWRGTANGFEAIAAQHNDTVLILDEMSQVEPDEVGKIVYMLMNGQGKARASQTGSARPTVSWRQMIISTGEVGLKEYIESGGGQVMAGQQTRLIDISADAGARQAAPSSRSESKPTRRISMGPPVGLGFLRLQIRRNRPGSLPRCDRTSTNLWSGVCPLGLTDRSSGLGDALA
jgi:putative DNA primase/helicase